MKSLEVLKQYQGLSAEALVEEGKKAYAVFGEMMDRNGYASKDIIAFATMLVRLTAGADGYGAKEELDLFQKITGIETDEKEFTAMTKSSFNEGFISGIDQIVDSLDKDAKEAVLAFACVFFAGDKTLSDREIYLLKRLEA